MYKLPTIVLIIFSILACNKQIDKGIILEGDLKENEIIIKAKENGWYGTLLNGYYSIRYQSKLDSVLRIDSTDAYIWQQKAMPLYKQGKYEQGKPFLDKAVKYNRAEYLPYRAFMKCIFSREYNESIVDFELCKKEFGNMYEMDHTYNFYIALSFLQLNEFYKAETILKKEIDSLRISNGEDWVHHLDLFYYGISLFEQNKYNDAIIEFDKSLEKYPEFSDALYYKSLILYNQKYFSKADSLMLKAKEYFNQGYTINEDNTAYERYPYQIRGNVFYFMD